MKKLNSVFLLVLMSFTLATDPISQKERDFMEKNLGDTKAIFLNAIKNLRNDQLDFKPSPDQWSIRECVEHLAVAEKGLFEMMKGNLTQPAEPEKYKAIKITDEVVEKMMSDRSNKVKTSEMLEPKGRFKTIEEATKAFLTEREAHIQYVKTTKDDLRAHVTPHPAFKALDCYQWLIILYAHTKRHTLQIEEIKSNPNFPR